MELVKKVWKAYVLRKKNRWEQINALWTSCLEEIIKDLTKPVKASRRAVKKRSKDPTIKYMEITPGQKTQVLTGLMLTARRRYRERLRAYLTSQHDLLRKGVKAFQSALTGNEDLLMALPTYDFLPTRDEMKSLIDKIVAENNPKK